MDKRLVLNKQQSEVVDRIKEIFGELQKEGVAIGVRFAQDHLERNILCLINAEEVSDIQSSWEFMVDQDDSRRSYAYIDEKCQSGKNKCNFLYHDIHSSLKVLMSVILPLFSAEW